MPFRRFAFLAVVVSAAFLVSASALEAQAGAPAEGAPTAPAGPARPRETVFSLIMKGRWIMIPMGICSVILLTLAIERAISLRKSRIGSKTFLARITRALPSRSHATRDQVSSALAECDGDASIVSKVLRNGVEKIHRDEAHAQAYLEEAAAKEMHVLKRKLRPFNVIASLAPLLGLLGTISGMITCFEKATEADSGSRVTTLTKGIYEALVATATGLSIAILGLILYHYFLGKVERVVDLVDESASEFLDHYYGGSAAPRPRITSSPAPSGISPSDANALEAGT